jgi:hypothetical protein
LLSATKPATDRHITHPQEDLAIPLASTWHGPKGL